MSLGVAEDLRQEPIRIKDCIVVVRFLIYLAVIKVLELRRIAVAIFNVAAHDMKDNEIFLIGIDVFKEVQQGTVQGGFLQVSIDPFGYVRRIGNKGNGCIRNADRALVAEPICPIAGFFCHVNDRNRFVKFFVIVEIRFRQGVFQYGNRIPDATVNVRE